MSKSSISSSIRTAKWKESNQINNRMQLSILSMFSDYDTEDDKKDYENDDSFTKQQGTSGQSQ